MASSTSIHHQRYLNPMTTVSYWRVLVIGAVSNFPEGNPIHFSFFKKGYPPQARFRSLITEKEWKRLNQEFVDVWNSFEATGPLPFLGVCCTYTGLGMFFLCIPCCWLSSLLEKRKKAVQVVVAKANNYIFRI